jgi:VIT1/CCC1 family predicted Fe2+/Mn2+ transporter
LIAFPIEEEQELAKIYVQRGLSEKLANDVARELTEHNALEAHARDELGINEITQANPFQAALASGAAFVFGGALPVFVAFLGNLTRLIYLQYGFAIVFLILLGAIAAKAGGSNVSRAIIRITFWGTLAMGLTGLIGYLFGVNVV